MSPAAWRERYAVLAGRLPELASRARPVLCGLGACVDVYLRLDEAVRVLGDATESRAALLRNLLLERARRGVGGEIRFDWPGGAAWLDARLLRRVGVIVGLCEELAVSLYPAGGFSSITFAYEAAEFIRADVENTAKTAHIIYIGDYDPAGVLIDRSIEAELRRHLNGERAALLRELFDDLIPRSGADLLEAFNAVDLSLLTGVDAVDLTFHRLAITEAQIAEYDLPTKPRKETDRRALHVKETVEAEAMPAAIMRALLRREIEAMLPPNALEVAKTAEESEREHLRRWAELMANGGAP